MKLTIGRNKAKAEEVVWSIQIILTKRLSFLIQFNRPITFDEVLARLGGNKHEIKKRT